ncbi:MAG: NADH-quinone oxidoreductase subunit C [Flavobacteriales bacterium]
MPSFAIKADRDQLVTDRLTATFSGEVLSHERLYDVLCFTVQRDRIIDILRFLRDELGFNFLTSACGMHHPGQELELGMVYHLHSMRNGHRIRVKTYMPLKDTRAPDSGGRMAHGQLDGARGVGFLRHPLHRPPEPEAHPEHGGLPGLPPAEGLSAGGPHAPRQER